MKIGFMVSLFHYFQMAENIDDTTQPIAICAHGVDIAAFENPNKDDVEMEKDLYSAIHEGDSAKVRMLLTRGVSPNCQYSCEDDRTALQIACYRMEDECAFALLDAGADANMTDSRGQTALMYCVDSDECESYAILRRIVDMKFDLDAKDW